MVDTVNHIVMQDIYSEYHKNIVDTVKYIVDTVKHLVDTVTHIVDTVKHIVDTVKHLVDTVKHMVDTVKYITIFNSRKGLLLLSHISPTNKI